SLGVADRVTGHHPRPCADHARAHLATPHPAPAGGGARGRVRRCDPLRRGAADTRSALMFLTGRLPILVALGVIPAVLLSLAGAPAWLAALGWLALCAILAGADAGAAPSPRALKLSRDLPARTRL